MYIVIKNNPKGTLEVNKKVIIKLIKNTIISNSAINDDKNIDVLINLFKDNELYILMTIKVENQKIEELKIKENKIFNIIEKSLIQSISIKPKNINISYKK